MGAKVIRLSLPEKFPYMAGTKECVCKFTYMPLALELSKSMLVVVGNAVNAIHITSFPTSLSSIKYAMAQNPTI